MRKLIYPFVLLVIIGMLLAACGGNATPAPLPTPQNFAALVGITLTTQYDTAAVFNTVGQIVRFKYIIKMDRNDITDNVPPNPSISGITAVCPSVNTIGNLNDRFDAGEILECTGDYILTQADLDKGSITNMATAVVYSVNSNQVSTTVATIPAKAIKLAKTASSTTYQQAGQKITFTYTITNSGSTPLGPDQFRVTDTGINNNTPFACGNPDATLASGANLTCTQEYTVTAADVGQASISSSATASGGGVTTTQPASVTLTRVTPPTGAVSSGTNVQHTVREGEWLWQIARCYSADPQQTVKANPQVDPKMLKAGMVVTVPNVGSVGSKVVHAPPELCVKFHTVQSGDTWTSIAQSNGADPGLTQLVNANTMIVGKTVKVPLYTAGLNIPLINAPSTTTPPTSSTGMSLTVTANPTTYNQAGQTITFTYVIKNTGTTTIGPGATPFTVTDLLISSAAFNCGPANNTLAPGASTTCSANYIVTQEDMNDTTISNSATASGGGAPTTSPATSISISKAVANLTLSVVANPTTYNQAGQTITFTYILKNNGTTNLGPDQFKVTEGLTGGAAINCGSAGTTLAPGATLTCSTSYVITQDDLNDTTISSSATATGGGASTTQPASATITKQ